MPAGEVLDHVEQRRLQRAVEVAEQLSGLTFSVYVGPGEVPVRRHAERLHAGLSDADDAVLVFCDPAGRALEIVTGSEARRWLGTHEEQLNDRERAYAGPRWLLARSSRTWRGRRPERGDR